MRRYWKPEWLLLLACLAGSAHAQDSGIAAIAHVRVAAAAQSVPELPAADFQTSARRDRLDGAVAGAGWWRVQPQSA
ncbi:MAG: hypothetical protein JWL98_1969, partial [Xanthomonadaceae bacterium]|nr:hypothetical protein [Xanthomonadaceae bacterium]